MHLIKNLNCELLEDGDKQKPKPFTAPSQVREGARGSSGQEAPCLRSWPGRDKDTGCVTGEGDEGTRQNVKTDRLCTHMVKEPGGADTLRRSAACT